MNYGGSPGDDAHAEPYLYVGPWALPEQGGVLERAVGRVRGRQAEVPDAATAPSPSSADGREATGRPDLGAPLGALGAAGRGGDEGAQHGAVVVHGGLDVVGDGDLAGGHVVGADQHPGEGLDGLLGRSRRPRRAG